MNALTQYRARFKVKGRTTGTRREVLDNGYFDGTLLEIGEWARFNNMKYAVELATPEVVKAFADPIYSCGSALLARFVLTRHDLTPLTDREIETLRGYIQRGRPESNEQAISWLDGVEPRAAARYYSYRRMGWPILSAYCQALEDFQLPSDEAAGV